VALARSLEGFAELCRLLTARHLQEDFRLGEALATLSEEVVLLVSDPPLLSAIVRRRGGAGLYAELVDHGGGAAERRRLRDLVGEARRLGVPPAATNAVHFAEPSGHRAHRLLGAIRTCTTLGGLPPGHAVSAEAWLKPARLMTRLFRERPEAVRATLDIAEACRVELPVGRLRLPPFPLPPGETAFSYLWALATRGLRERYRPPSGRAVERLASELKVIEDKALAPYFLVVWDINEWARVRGIPTVGRGSAANSLVCYCLGITEIDPLAHNLYFERFLSPERTDCPDIDLDFPWNQRDAVVEHVYERYGRDHVAMISTHVTFRGRGALREVGKALGLPADEIDGFVRRLPGYVDLAGLERARRELPECRELPLEEEPFRTLCELGRAIEGFPRHLGIHCGGLVVSPEPITNLIPLEEAAKGLVITQYDMYPVEDMGLVKIDLLGQRALSVVMDTVAAVGERYGEEVDFAEVDPVADPETKALMREGRTMGCFYVESPGMRNLLKKLRVEDFDTLVAASSIIRPGVADSGMMRAFIDRYRGRQPVAYLHPVLEEVLGDTLGVMIYQEDVIKVAHAVAGMSLGEAEGLRRCMSKKRHWEAMSTYRERFLRGAGARGIGPDVAGEIWRQIESFGGYAFCKAHSASFALVSYRTAYLKARWPAEFLAAVLSNQGGFYGASAYVEEARRLGLRVLPPDVNTSGLAFSAEGWPPGEGPADGRANALRVGLMQVGGASRATMEAVVEARTRQGSFASLGDFLSRVPAELDEAAALIKAGAFGSLGRTRPELLWELKLLYGEVARLRAGGGEEPMLFSARPARKGPPVPKLAEHPFEEVLALEQEVLGLTVSAHPLARYRSALRGLPLLPARALGEHVGRRVRLVGWLVTSKRTRTRRGQWMRFLTLEDETAIYDATLFPAVYQRFGHLVTDRGPYLVAGRVEPDGSGTTVTAEELERLEGERRKGERRKG
jgi:error-prone DNA polymerase